MKKIKDNLFFGAVLLLWTFGASAVAPFALWIGVEAIIITMLTINILGGLKDRPRRLSKEYPADQRNWLKRARKKWAMSMESAGLCVEIPNRNPDLPSAKFLPLLVSDRPSALGPILTVRPAPGHQSVEDILNAQGNLESIWNAAVRTKKVGPAAVEITVEFEAPLEGARDALGEDWTVERSAL